MKSSSRIKILYIINGPWGAMGTTASYMLPLTMKESGYDIQVVAFAQPHSPQPVSKKPSDFVKEINCPDFPGRVKIIRAILGSFKPDIVHMFAISQFAFYPLLCSIGNKYNCYWLIDIRSPPLRSKPLPICLKPLKALQSFAKQVGFNCITSHVKSSARDYFFYLCKPLYEVPFGVDIKRIPSKVLTPGTTQPVKRFLYLGSIAKLRKLNILLYAVGAAREKLNTTDFFHIDFIGEGDAIEELKRLSIQLHLEDVITFKGLMAQNHVFQQLQRYDIGIGYVPYEQYMGSPALKVIEYMAAGIGVIASDTDGVKINVRDRENGILFKNTVNSIASTIINIVHNGYPTALISEGLRTAQKCSWQKTVKNNLIPVYKKMLSGHPEIQT